MRNPESTVDRKFQNVRLIQLLHSTPSRSLPLPLSISFPHFPFPFLSMDLAGIPTGAHFPSPFLSIDPAGIRTGAPGGGESSRGLRGRWPVASCWSLRRAQRRAVAGRPSGSELRQGSDQRMVGERRWQAAAREKRGFRLPAGGVWSGSRPARSSGCGSAHSSSYGAWWPARRQGATTGALAAGGVGVARRYGEVRWWRGGAMRRGGATPAGKRRQEAQRAARRGPMAGRLSCASSIDGGRSFTSSHGSPYSLRRRLCTGACSFYSYTAHQHSRSGYISSYLFCSLDLRFVVLPGVFLTESGKFHLFWCIKS